MRSNDCYLYKGKGRNDVLREVRKTAQYCDMSDKDQLRLRLLAEELIGMLTGILGEYKACFWMEEEHNNFTLHLLVKKTLAAAEKKKLLSASTSGRNEATGGVMGKIRNFFENCMDNYEECGSYNAKNGTPLNDMYSGCSISGSQMTWSLKEYNQAVKKKDKTWDELEKSIVGQLADDVLVKIHGDQTEVLVKKQFAGMGGVQD